MATPRKRNESFIAQRRIALGITQEQLAEIVGVKRMQIYLWENGKNSPRAAHLVKLAAALNCSIDELLQSFDTKNDTAE